MAALLLWQLPEVRRYNLGVITYIVYVLAAILPAICLFGIMRSTGNLSGKHLGIAFEFGGPAALFAFVLLVGIYYEISGQKDDFSVSVYLHLQNNKNALVPKDGTMQINLKNPLPAEVKKGFARFNDIASKYNGDKVGFLVQIDDYEPVDMSGTIELKPNSVIYIPMRAIKK